MKSFFVFAPLIALFTFLCLYIAEQTDVLAVADQRLETSFELRDRKLFLTWKPFAYPCTYRVETFSKSSGMILGAPEYHKFAEAPAEGNFYEVPSTAIPMFYSIEAHGMFDKVFESKIVAANPNFKSPPSPVPINHYTVDSPASLMPFLLWHTVPEAVCYEVELLSAPPEIEGGISLSKMFHLFSTQQIFTNGYQADLRPFQNQLSLYWRARALGFHHEPIGEFCKAEPIVINLALPMPDCPLINNFDQMPNFEQPLYPVYSWIPLNRKSVSYEVELLNHPPTMEHDVLPSPDSLWRQSSKDVASLYDEYARPFAGPYYWRVRAIDEHNVPIGTWSDTEKFVVKDYTGGVDVAIFGDSISHGGGAISYPPTALEYSYATYLDFKAINLSRSGDTSHTTLERFDNDVLPFKPKNLIILTGTNSLRAREIKAEDVIEDINQLKLKCELNNIRPIFLTLMPINPTNIQNSFHTATDPNWRQKLNTINDHIRAQRYFIDLEPYFYDANKMQLDDRLSVDGLHPDIKGKMMMAELINQHQNVFDR